MALDPSIILRAGDALGKLPNYGDVMEQRTGIQARQQSLAEHNAAYAEAERQRQLATQGAERNRMGIAQAASGDFAGADAAYGAGVGDLDVHKHISGLQDEHRAQARERAQMIGAAALEADTPEKWDAAVDALVQAGHPDLAEYKGKFSPETRQAVINSALTAEDAFKRHDEQAKQAYTAQNDEANRGQRREAAYVGAGYLPPDGMDASGGSPVAPAEPGRARGTPVPNGRAVAERLFPGVRVTDNRRDPNSSLGRANPGSWHVKSGGAVDVAPIEGMSFDQYVQGYRDAGYGIIEARDEVNNPSGHATGPHWHVVVGQKNAPPQQGARQAAPGGLRPIPGGKADPNRPKPPSTRASFRPLTPEEANERGLPKETAYQISSDGEVKAVVGQQRPLTRQQETVFKAKLSNSRAIKSQLDRFERAMIEAEKKGFTGYVGGRVPGGLDKESNSFDKARATLAALIRQLTRTPGEGAMSDYESRLAENILPNRTDTKEGRRESIAGLRELITNINMGYQEALGSSPGGGSGATPAKGSTPTRINSAADYANLPKGASYIAPGETKPRTKQ